MSVLPSPNSYRPYDPVYRDGIIGKFNAPGNYIFDAALPAVSIGDEAIKSGQILKTADGTLRNMRGTNALLWNSGSDVPQHPGVDLTTAVTYVQKRYGDSVPEDLDSIVTEGDLIPGGKVALNHMAMVEGLKIRRELDFLNLCVAANTGQDTNLTAGSGWNEAGGDPIGNIKDAAEYVSRTGFDADTMVIGRAAWWALMNNDALVERMSTGGSRHGMSYNAFAALMQDLFGIDRVLIAKVRYTAENAKGTPTIGDALGDTCIVYKRVEQGVQVEGQAGDVAVTPGWIARVQGFDLRLDNFRDDRKHQLVHRASFAEALAVMDTGYAAGIYNCVV